MSEHGVALYLEHLKGQGQFAYFQLGLAASAIAFAIHQTKDATLSETPWQLGAAVALWAISFAAGCFGIEARQKALALNAKFLFMLRKGAPELRSDPDVVGAIKGAEEVVEKEVNRPYPRFRLQMWSLFTGALSYIWGHLIMMAY